MKKPFYGFDVEFSGDDAVLDDFIMFCERNRMVVGGGGYADRRRFFVTGRRRGMAEGHRQALKAFMGIVPGVGYLVIGKLEDAN